MPELPDVTLYVEALQARIVGQTLQRARLASPFLLRTADPPLTAVEGKRVLDVSRVGKRIVVAVEEDLFLIFHLMIAGRFHWREAAARIPGKVGLAAFDCEAGTLLLTEASSRKRASLHLVQGASAVAAFQRGGVEVLQVSVGSFREALWRESHTLKRALTDPDLFSGIGNAYSDEILHQARLSPLTLTRRLTEPEVERLYRAARETLHGWIERLRAELGGAFPEKVTAFRPGMAVHGRFGQPCPACGAPVQRIVYAENECNYCPGCQTEGRLLADRALSQLLKGDWPRTLEELEQRRLSY
ncbi:MAG: formamidopyrimidine-DNA glycosylase [Chloroflexi bacterium]|nr:formamidopyrimidine-DNA glycosylase [Chloroflexota bacterium]